MSGDPKKGEKMFKARAAQCHNLQQGVHGLGPSLYGIFGRRVASEQGYNYSSVMQANRDQYWTEESLNRFLENPRKFMPGTKMGFEGIKKPEDREHLIAYLKSVSEQVENASTALVSDPLYLEQSPPTMP